MILPALKGRAISLEGKKKSLVVKRGNRRKGAACLGLQEGGVEFGFQKRKPQAERIAKEKG